MKKQKRPARKNVHAELLVLRRNAGAGNHHNRTRRATQVARVAKHKKLAIES